MLFKINENISLALEGKKTEIYIDSKKFIQCKHLFLIKDLKIKQGEQVNQLKSIDDVAEYLDDVLEGEEILASELGITPEQEFWAHCSNLQAWVENKYNTQLLHSNLAFPLLEKLSELGDLQARRVFKEEIARRYNEGSKKTRDYLVEESYFDLLSREEKLALIESSEEITAIKELEKILNKEINILSSVLNHPPNIEIDKGRIIFLDLSDQNIREVPFCIFTLKYLKELRFSYNKLNEIPSEIAKLKRLELLDLRYNFFKSFPNELEGCASLRIVNLPGNPLNINLPKTKFKIFI